jgi:hypothetical protein
MTPVYIVKSFGHEGYKCLNVFANEDRAVAYANKLGLPFANTVGDLGDEFVEIEPFELEDSL